MKLKKTIISLITFMSFISLLRPPASLATDCTSAPGGDITISETCNYQGSTDGADDGNLIISGSGTNFIVTNSQTINWGDGKSITIDPGTSISINSSAKLQQSNIWTPSSNVSTGYPDPIGVPGAVLNMKLDEDAVGNAIDYSGNSNTGTSTGTTVVSGKYGNARSFTGTNNISLGNKSIVDSLANLTVSAWIYPTAQTAETHFRVFSEEAVLYVGQYANQASFYMGNGSSWLISDTTGGALTINSWNHVAWVKSGTAYYVYINGILTKTGSGAPASLGTSANINYISTFDGTNQPWVGTIDEVQIFNRALSASEVMALSRPSGSGFTYFSQTSAPDASTYRRRKDIVSPIAPKAWWKMDETSGTSFIDSSENNLTGTASTTGVTNGSGKYGKAGSFDGSTKYITVADNANLKPSFITVSAWVNPTSFADYSTVVMKSSTHSMNDGYGLAHYTGANDINFFVNNYSTAKASGTLTTGKWSHVVGTYDGVNIKLYINGVLIQTTAYITPISHSTGSLQIGMGAGGGGTTYLWNGAIDDVRIYNMSIPPPKVQELYFNGYMTGCTSGNGSGTMTSYYRDADGDGKGIGSTANLMECYPPSGFVSNNTDCNDSDAARYQSLTCYQDTDGDGYRSAISASRCVAADCSNSIDNYNKVVGDPIDSNDAQSCSDGTNPGGTCQKCVTGAVALQASNEDLWGQCTLAYNGCSGVCVRTASVGNLCAGSTAACAAGANANVADQKVCSAGSEIVASSSVYASIADSCSAGSCSGTRYYRACNGAGATRSDNTGAATSTIYATTGNTFTAACASSTASNCASRTTCKDNAYCNGSGTCNTMTNVGAGADTYNDCTASYNACSGNNKIGPDGNCNGAGACNTTGQSSACSTAGVCQGGGGCSAGNCTAVTNDAADQDANNECASYNCANYVWGFWTYYGGRCARADLSTSHDGMCNGAGACYTSFGDSCSSSLSQTLAVCYSELCEKAGTCVWGSLATTSDTTAEVCNLNREQGGCASGWACIQIPAQGIYGVCATCTSIQSAASCTARCTNLGGSACISGYVSGDTTCSGTAYACSGLRANCGCRYN